MIVKRCLRFRMIKNISRNFCDTPSTSPASGSNVNANVPGLSTAVIHVANASVGPGVDPKKTGAYKVPEYFCYDNTSYFEAELEMAKYRLKQPSSLKK